MSRHGKMSPRDNNNEREQSTMKPIRPNRFATLFAASLALAVAAHAADYHWTGAAGDNLWSSAGNWNDSTGNPAAAAPTPGTAYTYNFGQQKAGGPKISWGDGLVVTQDMAVVIGSALALNPPTTDGESITFVTANGGSMKFGGESGIYL